MIRGVEFAKSSHLPCVAETLLTCWRGIDIEGISSRDTILLFRGTSAERINCLFKVGEWVK